MSGTDELPTTKGAKSRPGSPYGHVFPGPSSKGAAGTPGGVPRRAPGAPGSGHLPPSRQRFEELPRRVEPRKMSFLERLYLPLLSGLLVTARHFFRNLIHGPKYTIEYPEERRAYSHRFRGHHILTTRPDGSPRCVACYLCAQACPAECIHIEAGEHPDVNIEKYPVVYEIDMLRCVFCGYCVDACPEEAIIMSNNYDMAYFSRDQTIAGKADLMKPFTFDPERLGYRPLFPEEQAIEEQRREGSGGPDDAERARMRRQAFDLVSAAREARDSDGTGARKGAA